MTLEPMLLKGKRGNHTEFAGFLFFLVVALVPIAASLVYAFGYSMGLAGLLSDGFTLKYWEKLGGSTDIWTSFAFSIGIAIVVMAVSVAVALALGIAMRDRLNRGWLSYMVYLPLALPGTVLAFVVFQFLSGAGMLSRILFALGLVTDPVQTPSMIHDQFGIGIIIALVFVSIPFFTIFFAQLYQTERVHELTQLAQTLGAGKRATLLKVAVPILLKRAFPTIILYLIGTLGAYEVPLLLGAQSPQMVSVLTMRKYGMFDLAQKPEAFICAILYTVISLALIVIAYRSVDVGKSS